uniref:Uncharacterized protein n=1 Tax=Anguilla anguilla TaxID=7936 RepID=A0A0E9TBS5_ANGAN
MKEREIKETEA